MRPPESYNHEFTDAKSFAEWDIDFLKYDFCFRNENIPAKIPYIRMGLVLANGDIAIGFFNLGDTESDQWGSWLIPEELGRTRKSITRLLMRYLWDGTEKYLENDIFMEKEIPPHSCRLFSVSLVSQ